MKKIVLILFLFFSILIHAQDISLYNQFNGHVDFTMIGNTLNLRENEDNDSQCQIYTSSSASLNLGNNDYIEAAYLYWAGSGEGEFQVNFNGEDVVAQRTFLTNWYWFPFFSAFVDVTTQVRNFGNGNYTLSNLDLNNVIPDYCEHGVNFGGWALIIVYSNNDLPINQVNVYDGMQSVVPNSVRIQLDNINVIDNIGAEIGFLAWEGDSTLAVQETLMINGDVIGNPPLNPFNNAFNSTNSFTGESNLYNMDLDVYNIENNIAVGDTSVTIELTSELDYVMISSVVTKLNTQLPDAIIVLNNFQVVHCNERVLSIDFTVANQTPATSILPENTPISFYAFDGQGISYLLGTHYTVEEIEVGDSVTLTHQFLALPNQIPNTFTLFAFVDDDGNGNSTIVELNESNNMDKIQIAIPELPIINQSNSLLTCNIGYNKGVFNLSESIESISDDVSFSYSFFEDETDLINDENEIIEINPYKNLYKNQTVYVRVTNPLTECYSIAKIDLIVENCPPIIPQLLPSNTLLEIDSLYNVFDYFEITIFNRYGNVVFEGDNNSEKWNGTCHGNALPSGTYFYIIKLNDGYFETLNGWIYLL